MSGAGGTVRAVVVSFCNEDTIIDCLQRLLHAPEVGEIVLIDNGSEDRTIERASALADQDSRIALHCDPSNPGFASACNRGASDGALPWLAFVNPDCLVEPDTFTRLLTHADAVPVLGALGCAQVDGQGVEDAAVRRRDPSLRQILFAGGARDSLNVDNDGTPLQSVDALSGALMLMPTSVFNQVGGFDPGYRMHAEDLDLCRRVRDAGFTVRIANDVRVTHLRGISSRSRPMWVEWQKHRGLWRYFCKFDAAQTSISMRAVLWLGLWAHCAIAAPRAFLNART